MIRRLAFALALPLAASAWGDKGHLMSARVAARALPAGTPSFLREAVEELAYLCIEPHHWRDRRLTPALRAGAEPDHYLDLEQAPPVWPPTRYEFFRALTAGLTVEEVGTAPYAIAESAEKLTIGFREWRKAPADGRIKRQIEQNIIYSAGILGHWITDVAQPLHTTVHYNGWDPAFANPRGFAGKGIHRRFETDFVDASITEEDIAAKVGPPQAVGAWLQEAERDVRAGNKLVERVYELDQRAAFGSGKEPAEAKEFVAVRLAAGAERLRNFWHSAWIKSQQP